MGSTPSKEELMIRAIENQDIDEMKMLMKDLTSEKLQMMCKYVMSRGRNHFTILHYAAWQNNPNLLELLLDYVDDLEIRDDLGWTPLMTAVNRGSKENVKLLLKRGAKVDCDFAKGINLIAIAMNYNDIGLIQILMDYGVQLTDKNDGGEEHSAGRYLLHFAVDDGLIDVAKLLIERGKMPVNALDQSGWSPLHLAAGHNYLDIVRLLLKNGAHINIKDHHDNTPLAWAKEMNAKLVMQELEKYGGIADKEWHGEKLKLNHYEQQMINQSNKLHGIENSQFEIDESNQESIRYNENSDAFDALQRQAQIKIQNV